jgi:hypothetical protein
MTVDGSPPGGSPHRPSVDESVGELISQLTTDLGQLTRQELALAKAETPSRGEEGRKGRRHARRRGLRRLDGRALQPDQTVESLKEDAKWLKTRKS